MKKKFVKGHSTNSSWERRKSKKRRVFNDIRIIDRTGISDPKKIMVHITNLAAGFGEVQLIWREFIMVDGDIRLLSILKPTYLQLSYDDESYDFPEFVANKGEKYTVSGEEIATSSASSPNEIQVVNSDARDLVVRTVRSSNTIGSVTLAEDGDVAFDYRSTFYIQGTLDAEAVGDPDDANTQISLLGVKSADIIVTYDEGFSFTLANIGLA